MERSIGMGAWGTGPFENDAASDWVYELEESDDFEFVREQLRRCLAQDAYLDSYYGTTAVAAAEVVAAGSGAPRPRLPEEVIEWLAGSRGSPTATDRALAVSALLRVRGERSELRDLWNEAGDPAWDVATEELLDRLNQAR